MNQKSVENFWTHSRIVLLLRIPQESKRKNTSEEWFSLICGLLSSRQNVEGQK